MRHITIGSVPYLNEKPLTRWFSHTEEGRASGISVVYAVPSELARMLAAGEIDAALVSSWEFFRTEGYRVAPGVSISGQGAIESVRAFSRLPWRDVQSVALDTSSLTSVALLKIVLAERHECYPQWVQHAPDLDAMLSRADAALLIGDAGWKANGAGLRPLDLGAEWRALTNLPFVYAVWLGRPERLTPSLIDSLQRAKAWGVTQFDVIAGEQADALDVPAARCLHYLTDVMDYDLGSEHRDALHLFGQKALSHGLLAAPPSP